jgi:hypothetical protein
VKLTLSAPALWPLCILTTIVFVVLRLTDHIGWPWVWVLSPLWIGVGLICVVIACVIGFVASAPSKLRWRLS